MLTYLENVCKIFFRVNKLIFINSAICVLSLNEELRKPNIYLCIQLNIDTNILYCVFPQLYGLSTLTFKDNCEVFWSHLSSPSIPQNSNIILPFYSGVMDLQILVIDLKDLSHLLIVIEYLIGYNWTIFIIAIYVFI